MSRGLNFIGIPSSISTTSTGLSSSSPDSAFVPPSFLARFQPSAPARFEIAVCSGFGDPRIDEFFHTCKKTKEYLQDHFVDSHGGWRHKKCEVKAIYDVNLEGPPDWKMRRNGLLACSHCLSVINVLGRHVQRLKDIQTSEDEPADSLLSAMQLIKRQLVEIFFLKCGRSWATKT